MAQNHSTLPVCAPSDPAANVPRNCKGKSTRKIALKLDHARQHLDHPSFPDRVKTERSLRTPRVSWMELSASAPLPTHVIVWVQEVLKMLNLGKEEGLSQQCYNKMI